MGLHFLQYQLLSSFRKSSCPLMPAHLKCNHCSHLLHSIDSASGVEGFSSHISSQTGHNTISVGIQEGWESVDVESWGSVDVEGWGSVDVEGWSSVEVEGCCSVDVEGWGSFVDV